LPTTADDTAATATVAVLCHNKRTKMNATEKNKNLLNLHNVREATTSAKIMQTGKRGQQ